MSTTMNAASVPALTRQASPRAEADVANASEPSVQGERRVLERIHERCGASILESCTLSLLPPAFLAALTANESAGVPGAARFEPAVYRRLQALVTGQISHYGSIDARQIQGKAQQAYGTNGPVSSEPAAPNQARPIQSLADQIRTGPHTPSPVRSDQFHARYLTPGFLEQNRTAIGIATLDDDVVRQLATSWGYTQIMGYHTLGRACSFADLLDPGFHFRLAVELLEQFAADYNLDPQLEFEQLFRCWNTGRPYGQTYDPAYPENGLRRMQIYREILKEFQKGPAGGYP